MRLCIWLCTCTCVLAYIGLCIYIYITFNLQYEKQVSSGGSRTCWPSTGTLLWTEVHGDVLTAWQVQMFVTLLAGTQWTTQASITLRDEHMTGAKPLRSDAVPGRRRWTDATCRHGYGFDGRNQGRPGDVAMLSGEAVQRDVDYLTWPDGDMKRARTRVDGDHIVGTDGVDCASDMNATSPVENDRCTTTGCDRVDHCATQWQTTGWGLDRPTRQDQCGEVNQLKTDQQLNYAVHSITQ